MGSDLGNAWLRQNSAGSGPWVLRSWRANESVVLDRNPPHAGAGAITRVVTRHVADSTTQLLLLQAPARSAISAIATARSAHDLPILSLCDTPGFMVGPDAERTALVRRVCRMFVGGANLSLPFFTVVLRKGYGLGAQAMAAGCFHAPVFNVSWPTGEFGGMGLEGAVRLGFRKEPAAIDDVEAREVEFRRRVDEMYARGKATSMASVLEIDNVIDTADTRHWIACGLRTVQPPALRRGKKHPSLSTW